MQDLKPLKNVRFRGGDRVIKVWFDDPNPPGPSHWLQYRRPDGPVLARVPLDHLTQTHQGHHEVAYQHPLACGDAAMLEVWIKSRLALESGGEIVKASPRGTVRILALTEPAGPNSGSTTPPPAPQPCTTQEPITTAPPELLGRGPDPRELPEKWEQPAERPTEPSPVVQPESPVEPPAQQQDQAQAPQAQDLTDQPGIQDLDGARPEQNEQESGPASEQATGERKRHGRRGFGK